MKFINKGLLALTAVAMMAFQTACTDEESALGIDLVDTATLYDGLTDTLYADTAWTEYEDSLLTSNYSFGIIGNYTDATFGKVSSWLYTQIALPPNTNDIAFDNSLEIDSVVMTLAKSQLFPDTSRTYNFHIEVMQLAEPLLSDTSYYAENTLPVDASKVFFDGTVAVGERDTVISFKLDPAFYSVIRRTATAEEFIQQTKGLRVRLTGAGDEGMVSIDFSSSTTSLRAHYHYTNGTDTTLGFYTFLLGAGTAHFTHFEHDYTGTLFNGRPRLPGTLRLYLEPLGGHQVRLSFDRDIRAFREAHPWAVIHHAELVMSLSPESPAMHPDQILALGKQSDGTDAYIDDLIDLYTLSGYDGSYHEDGNYYRMRVTQHLQGLMRKGEDPGMLLLLNSRRNAAQRAVFYGTLSDKRPRIIFVYTE
ncbi:MAG: DUF4270 family protein [Bacteroidales bacterium]|nr:DUF4270 family protein [Bacteroidales bacterium]